MLNKLVVFVLLSLNIYIKIAEGANILAIHPYPGPSQYIVVQPYLKALAARGHNVTVINSFPQKEHIENFHDFPVFDILEMFNEDAGTDLVFDFVTFALAKPSKWSNLNMFSDFNAMISNAVLNNTDVQNKLLKGSLHFDLVIVEALQLDALYGFAQHFNAPLIGISTFGADSYIDDLMDNFSPMSYVPTVTSTSTDEMTYCERLQNVIDTIMERVHTHLLHLPVQVALYKHYFPDATTDLLDLRKNFSLMLLNQHFSLSFPRPYVPNMIEVGGWHMSYKPSPLPTEMETFLNESKQGVIYFALGSNLQSKDLPAEKLSAIMKVLAKLPQRVMWKFEDPDLPDKPDNVFIANWFPQPDILAHPNVKLFITHGGLISSIESVYHGKPIVGIPFFYDQFLNVQRAKSNGYGDFIEISALTVESFHAVIKRVLENPRFTKVAQQMSVRFRDQPQKPLDKAIYWTEYVLRHNGAPQMRVAAQRLNMIQRNSIDTIGVLVLGFVLIIITLVCLVRRVLSMFFIGKSIKLKSQ